MTGTPIAGIPLTAAPFTECVDLLCRPDAAAVHFVNAYTVALADDDAEYAALFEAPEAINFTDGTPLAWIGRRAYRMTAAQWPRVYGPDVMAAMLEREGFRHYLLGGTPDTLAALQAVIAHRWPQARIAGAESPPFRPLSDAEQREQDRRIVESGADFVWVGLGTPKQDWEVARLASSMPVVALAVGAAFDFIAGTKPQAPRWMQRSGTEWVYRLASEPRRLTKRYFWGNPRFLIAAARQPGLRKGSGLR